MNTYSITSALYDSSWPASPIPLQNDPVIWIIGTVNGTNLTTYAAWNEIQIASTAGGNAAVQSLLAYRMLVAYESLQGNCFFAPGPQPQFSVTPGQLAGIPQPITGQAQTFPKRNFVNAQIVLNAGTWSA